MICEKRHRGQRLLTSLLLMAAGLRAAPSWAHHGRDFLLSQTAELPHPGRLFLLPRQDYVAGQQSELELEPALVFGASARIALELHAHVAKHGGSDLEYEAIAPSIHVLLTPPDREWGLAFSGGYEFARKAGERPASLEGNSGEPSSEDERTDRVEARLALSGRHGANLLAVNLVVEKSRLDGADVEWGYSGGWRRDLREGLAWGLEAQGDLRSEGTHEALLGLYYEPSDYWTVNAGVGVGVGDEAPDFTVRTAVVVRLR